MVSARFSGKVGRQIEGLARDAPDSAGFRVDEHLAAIRDGDNFGLRLAFGRFPLHAAESHAVVGMHRGHGVAEHREPLAVDRLPLAPGHPRIAINEQRCDHVSKFAERREAICRPVLTVIVRRRNFRDERFPALIVSKLAGIGISQAQVLPDFRPGLG